MARGNAAYCAECIELMDWAEVIAVVQDTVEPEPVAVGAVTDTEPISTETATSTSSAPGHPDDAGADPFARRLI